MTVEFDSCLAALTSPGVVAFPTDTFYALSCDPLEPIALSRLRRLKGLPDRPLPVLIAPSYDPGAHGCTVSPAARRLMKAYWPGKVTIILPCDGDLVAAVGRSSDGAVGFRVPDYEWLLQLLERFGGALVGTSANPTGKPPARTAVEVRSYFGAEIDWVGDADSQGGQPSTVVDCTGDEPTIVREGAIPAAQIRRHQVSGSIS